ncbi:MAG: peptide-N-glycosidase F-related protein, partial [Bacteroidota bacterium]
DAQHPFYSNLVCYYKFNDHNGSTFADNSPGNHTASIMGQLDNNFVPGQTLFRNYTKLYERPNIIFNQDSFVSHIDTIIEIDTIENSTVTVVIYGDTLNPTVPTDTIWVYPAANYSYITDGTIDTTAISPDNTLHKHLWYWYGAPFEIVNQFELSRFITLYGNGTSLGTNGRTWVYDLTNLAPLLHDSVHLSSGNWQEWLDMKFIMIKGKPARDPISVVNLWNGDYGHNSAMETYLHPMRVKIDANAQNTMWRTINTGHGQAGYPFAACDEFCQNSQYGKVNGVQHFNQLVWRDDCGKNPLYPQGGTWVYQRSNWCPGSEVREYDWELTPYVTPGDSVTLDLDMDPPGTYNGNYVISTQLISFKQPNFSLDAEMYDILSPNDRDEWSRINPICSEPVVRIRNGGTTPLTSATITYGLDGGATYTYNWTGNLGFLQTADVTLASMYWEGNGSNKFYATISNPNGGTDLNEHNNTARTHFNSPAVYDLSSSTVHKFVLEVKTNLFGSETSYQLRSSGGVILLDRNNLANNTFYRDTFIYNEYECYTFEIFDAGEDGLSFWNNPDQGSGYARLKRADFPLILKSFPADFGAEFIHNFKINWPLGVTETKTIESSMNVVPNPAIDAIDVTVALTNGSDKVEATLMDLSGRILKKQIQPFAPAAEFNFDVTDLAQGLYFVKVKSGTNEFTEKFIKIAD